MVVIYDTGTVYEIDPSDIYDPFPEVGDGEKEEKHENKSAKPIHEKRTC